MNSPSWKKQNWTLARLASLLAGLSRRSGGLTIDQIKKRYGVGIRDLMLVTRRLGGVEDLGTQAWHHLDLRLDYDDEGHLEVGSIGAEALQAMTRLPREDAVVAAEALEGLALSKRKMERVRALAARLRKVARGGPAERSLLVRPGESRAERHRVELVSEAMEQGQWLSFDYHGAGATSTRRKARPLTLRRDGRVWRSLAWDADRQALRVFRLEHMRRIEPGEKAELAEAFDLEVLKSRNLAQFTPRGNEIPVKVKVSQRVYHEFKPAFKSGARKLTNGKVSGVMPASSPAWFVRTFLPYASEVQVTGPPAYKKAFKEAVDNLVQRHK